jgi:MFS family permease
MAGRRSLIALLVANAISTFGNVLAAIAIPWFVLITTESALQTGIAALFTSAPLAIGAFFGGALADRLGHRRASVIGDVVSAVSVAGIPLLHLLGVLEFWHILALGFLGSLFDAPAYAAREALLPASSRGAGVALERSTSFWTASEHASYVLGAPLAGVLIALTGAPALLWLDAASFVVSAALMLGVVPQPEPTAVPDSYRRELLEGLRFVLREPVIRTMVISATLGALLIDALAPVVLPVYARQQLGSPAALGLAVAAYGVGGLAGIGLFNLVARHAGRRALYVGLLVAYSASTYLLIPQPALVILVPVLALIGLTAGAIDPLERVLRQERTPPAYRGRVAAVALAVPRLATPISVFGAGLLLETLGLRPTLIIFAVGTTLVATWVALVPWLRHADRARASEAAPLT